jgi:hypothetical protein
LARWRGGKEWISIGWERMIKKKGSSRLLGTMEEDLRWENGLGLLDKGEYSGMRDAPALSFLPFLERQSSLKSQERCSHSVGTQWGLERESPFLERESSVKCQERGRIRLEKRRWIVGRETLQPGGETGERFPDQQEQSHVKTQERQDCVGERNGAIGGEWVGGWEFLRPGWVWREIKKDRKRKKERDK